MKYASGWGNVKNFFEKMLLTGEILKKLKMLKWGEPCLCTRHQYTNMVPPPIF